MSKYIDLNEATDLFEGIDATMTGGWVADTLEALPTIDIVHCEDCRLATYTVKNQRTHETFYACPYSSIHNEGKSFCSYGERIEE